jgi:hypothetical protein
VEARRAGEKEMIMRAEAVERELGEAEGAAEAQAVNDDEEQQRPREGLQRAVSKRPVRANGSSAVASRRKTMAAVLSTSSSPMRRNPRAPPSIRVENKKMRVLIPNYLKLISGKFTGRK